MAELADALDLGSSGSIPLEVRILSPAPFYLTEEIKRCLPARTAAKKQKAQSVDVGQDGLFARNVMKL